MSEINLKIKNAVCAPGINFSGNSCYPLEMIEEIFERLCDSEYKNNIVHYKFGNEKRECKLIELKSLSNFNNLKKDKINYKKFLVDIIDQVIGELKVKKINKEGFKNMHKHYNWIILPMFKNLRGKYHKSRYFRPYGPNKGNTWLSNFDIMAIFKQYEDVYPDFEFLGAVPRDFNDFERWNYCERDFNDFVVNGVKKTKFGIIFNHDLSGMSGSHWVALFFDMKAKKIYYQDSVGKEPKNEYVKLMDVVEKQMGKSVDRRVSKTEHQKANSECGVYSTSFILRLLNGESFEHIESYELSDDEVNKCRSVYFNNNDD